MRGSNAFPTPGTGEGRRAVALQGHHPSPQVGLASGCWLVPLQNRAFMASPRSGENPADVGLACRRTGCPEAPGVAGTSSSEPTDACRPFGPPAAKKNSAAIPAGRSRTDPKPPGPPNHPAPDADDTTSRVRSAQGSPPRTAGRAVALTPSNVPADPIAGF